MALNMPRFTLTSELHETSKVPYINEFINKITNNFYERCQNVENEIVTSLGAYDIDSINFRIKHKLPRVLS